MDLLEETGLLGSKSVESPMDPAQKLIANEGELFDNPERLVFKVNCLSVTRPYIIFSVSVNLFLSSYDICTGKL